MFLFHGCVCACLAVNISIFSLSLHPPTASVCLYINIYFFVVFSLSVSLNAFLLTTNILFSVSLYACVFDRLSLLFYTCCMLVLDYCLPVCLYISVSVSFSLSPCLTPLASNFINLPVTPFIICLYVLSLSPPSVHICKSVSVSYLTVFLSPPPSLTSTVL